MCNMWQKREDITFRKLGLTSAQWRLWPFTHALGAQRALGWFYRRRRPPTAADDRSVSSSKDDLYQRYITLGVHADAQPQSRFDRRPIFCLDRLCQSLENAWAQTDTSEPLRGSVYSFIILSKALIKRSLNEPGMQSVLSGHHKYVIEQVSSLRCLY